jgi:hypothetical protein
MWERSFDDPKRGIDVRLDCRTEGFGGELKNIFTLLLATCVGHDDIQSPKRGDSLRKQLPAIALLA